MAKDTSYESFLRVTEDGHIWWLLKDAICLGAGFLPSSDDDAAGETQLLPPNDRALVNQRTLIGALGDPRLDIKNPLIIERDGFRYVEAEEFLNWLSLFVSMTQYKVQYPDDLARKVKIAKAHAAASQKPPDIQKFESLTIALEDWVDKELNDIPETIRRRVEGIFLVPWEQLSGDQRRTFALQWDYQNDPDTEEERHYWWDFYARLDDLNTQIDEWESISTPTASDKALKESRLKQLRQELARMDSEEKKPGADYYPGRKRLEETSGETTPADFIPYPKAMSILREKWQATPEELVVWIFLGPELGGINAYISANELSPPPPFSFAYYAGAENYLSPLMFCWFNRDDINRFTPANRYITGKQLVERWGKIPDITPRAYINAKIAESRLVELHPIAGATQGTFDEQHNYPPLETGLFALSDIELIEAEEFDSAKAGGEQTTDDPGKNTQRNLGGRRKGILVEALEKVYLYFLDKGDIDILQPGEIRAFLREFKKLAKDRTTKESYEKKKVRAYVVERIKQVKIPFVEECSVVTQDRDDGKRTTHGTTYKEKKVSVALSRIRKKYPLPPKQ